jgi:hypothetical protein
MSRRSPLDPALGQLFSVRDARDAGVTSSRLRAGDLEAPFWGTRRLRSADTAFVHLGALAKRLPPDAVFSHSTAAAVMGIPLPSSGSGTDVHVSVPTGVRAPEGARIVGHQRHLSASETRTVSGLRVTSPARTWCDLATAVELADLVAAGDFLIYHEHPLIKRAELDLAVLSHVDRRGAKARRLAIALLSDRSESARESILRVLLTGAGFPVPSVNHEVFARNGRLIARVDLAWPEQKVALDYEGDHHRTDRRQWQRDIRRIEDLHDEGWRDIRVSANDLNAPERMYKSLRLALSPR